MTNKNNQSGVTLLIAVLIMSGLTLITVAVATLAVQELRASRAVTITEPGIAAAESGGELGLWAIKRVTSINTCPTLDILVLSNGARVNTCKSYGNATFNLAANVPFVFYLYDPNNINGDIDLSGYPYTWMDVTSLSGTYQVSINVAHIDGSVNNISPASSSVSPGNTQRTLISQVASGTEGRLKVTLQSIGNMTVAINTSQGMPGYPTVNAGGCSSKTSISNCSSTSQEMFSRRINITVPQ